MPGTLPNTLIRAAFGNTITQGLSVATGLQDKFDWRGVAAATVGAGVGHLAGSALGGSVAPDGQAMPGAFSDWGATGSFLRSSLINVATGSANALVRGGSLRRAWPGVVNGALGGAFGNAFGESFAGSFSGAGQQSDDLGDFIQQNQPGWTQRQANYDQIVGAFSNPGAMNGSHDVMLAAGPGGKLELGLTPEARARYVPKELADKLGREQALNDSLLRLTGETGAGRSQNRSVVSEASKRYASGAGDVRTTDSYSTEMPYDLGATGDPLTFEASIVAGQGLKSPSSGFWRGMSGEGRSVLEGPSSFGENLGLTVNGLATGPIRAAYGLVNELGNQYKDVYNLLTREGASYTPSSALGRSIQRQGVGSTLAEFAYNLGSAPTKPIFDLLEGNYRAAGEGLPGTVAMGMGMVRGVGTGLRLGWAGEGVGANSRLSLQEIASPYFVRVDPRIGHGPMAIDTSGYAVGEATLNGGVRNARQFWKDWSGTYADTLSDANAMRITAKQSPIVDNVWIRNFPEHSAYSGETLVHHHLEYGPKAIPLPGTVHSKQPGWGIWHPEHSGN